MKQIKYNSGGQPFFNSDFALQQSEIYKAIENQYADVSGGVVLSGCVVTGNSISAGLVYLDGKIRELASGTGLSFPCYIKASPQIDYDSRVHTEDNQNKTTKSEFKAEITTTIPVSGDYITVTASGVNRRLNYVLKNDQNGQYAPDAFTLNVGKVSYVELSRFTNQVVAGDTDTAIDFTTEIDDLNEFNVATGEFVATNSGIYSFHVSVRTDLTGEGFEISLEFWNGSYWALIGQSNRNVFSGQGTITASAIKKLSAGQKVRIIYRAFGSNKTLQYACASIARIA